MVHAQTQKIHGVQILIVCFGKHFLLILQENIAYDLFSTLVPKILSQHLLIWNQCGYKGPEPQEMFVDTEQLGVLGCL